MKAAQNTQSVNAWPASLDKVQAELQQALTAALAREQEVQEIPSENQSVLGNLSQWAERLEGLARCSKQAEQAAALVDLELQGNETGLQAWLESAANLRQKLADWEGGKT